MFTPSLSQRIAARKKGTPLTADETRYRHMKHLPLSDVDGVIDTICLCWKYEKAGFVEGVKVGIRLKQELAD